jgi:hypothetical protein
MAPCWQSVIARSAKSRNLGIINWLARIPRESFSAHTHFSETRGLMQALNDVYNPQKAGRAAIQSPFCGDSILRSLHNRHSQKVY